MLQRIHESPTSVVTPQIDAVIAQTFGFTKNEGIGCWLTFKWTLIEKAFLTNAVTTPAPIKSPVMAGGLFAIRREFFFKLGGYDPEFNVWGAEHIEFSFRIWLCGGKIECMPCSRIFHVFRKGGNGYTIPLESIWRNRLRTAAIWMEDYGEIAEWYNHHPDLDIGKFDKMLALKKQLQCKPFDHYLKTVDPDNIINDRKHVLAMGELRNLKLEDMCIDLLNTKVGQQGVGMFSCHGQRGQQSFLLLTKVKQVRLVHLIVTDHEENCFLPPDRVETCGERTNHFTFPLVEGVGAGGEAGKEIGVRMVWQPPGREKRCVAGVKQGARHTLVLQQCGEGREQPQQIFVTTKFPTGTWRPLAAAEEQVAMKTEL
eukprot:GDKI01020298.1.p1 GENE.GDKI01020298.1~~GDKI01020298.1.p1  ORF type:complete len:370 (-),score=130.65 GDKI01020298.1:23-1132(-)